MKGKTECGGLSQGEVGSSQGKLGLSQGKNRIIAARTRSIAARNALWQAKPAFPARVPPRSAVPAALVPQPSIWTGIGLRPQRIWHAAGSASTAPDRLRPEPAAATAP